MLSAIVITKNEERNIKQCLESIRWADEIVVVDSGSTDRTVEICRTYTDNVFIEQWHGFGPQKNIALRKVTHPWVLSLDADEFVPEALAIEIRETIAQHNTRDFYRMPRLSQYCGRYMKHSGWWPDYIVRLFKRQKGIFSNDLVHERLIVNGTIGTLKNCIMHDSFRTFEEVIDKMNSYSSAGAKMMFSERKKSSLTKAISHGLWNFFYTYIVRGGFLDGKEGFMLAVSNAEGTYYRYVKSLYMQGKGNK